MVALENVHRVGFLGKPPALKAFVKVPEHLWAQRALDKSQATFLLALGRHYGPPPFGEGYPRVVVSTQCQTISR